MRLLGLLASSEVNGFQLDQAALLLFADQPKVRANFAPTHAHRSGSMRLL
jgi:hypothetical protein